MMKQACSGILATVLAGTAIAAAQPAPGDAAASDPAEPAPPPPPGPISPYGPPPAAPDPAPSPRAAPRPVHPEPPARSLHRFPEVLTTPTGYLLPAGALYSRNAIDTGGGVSSDNRVGLGDVAEFGVATTDQVREHDTVDDAPVQIQPYVTASFRLGVDENRLFGGQPGVTLGFRKSFEREHRNAKSRIAELTLVASKRLGPDAALHVGGALWDASLQQDTGGATPHEVTLHGKLGDQLRVFGGFEARPLPRSQILVDLGWAPDLCYRCASDGTGTIKLRPELSWGVRYQVARFMHIESGVRVPDIGNFNLLDAQIFGQITLTSFALSDAVDNLK